MGKGNLISGSFWFIVSVFFTIESYRLGLGSLNQPGPGFLFFWAGIFLGILSLSLLVEAWGKSAKGDKKEIFDKRNLGKIALVLLATFLYAILIEKLGFILMTVALLTFILGLVEKKGWLFTVSTSVIITAAAYLVFQAWLKTQLPEGILEFLSY